MINRTVSTKLGEVHFAIEEIHDSIELAKLRKDLKEYCKQETLGLVRLLEKMRVMEEQNGEV